MAEAKERTSQETFLETLNSIIRKKLEGIILDTMGHPEKIPQDFFELRDIARQNSFSEIEDGFRLVFEQIGEIQSRAAIERIRSKGERGRDEAALQQYLIEKPGRLGLIEQGLVYQAHEKRIKSGRLDILANDGNGKEVKIELKARDYDPRKSNFQIMKYFNDDETEEGRLIFVAPTIDAGLITSLAQYQKAGRMRFFEFEKKDGDYSFSEVKPEDIKEPVPIDWAKSRKSRVDEGNLVTVTSAAGKRVSKSEEETELTSYPFYYQILLQNRPNLKNKKRYLKPIFIERIQMDALEKLVSSSGLDEAVNTLERNLPWQISSFLLDKSPKKNTVPDFFRRIKSQRKTVPNKIAGAIWEGFSMSLIYLRDVQILADKEFGFSAGLMSHIDIEPREVTKHMEGSQETLHNMLTKMLYQDEIVTRLGDIVNKTLRKAVSRHDRVTEEVARRWLFLVSNYTGVLLDEFLQAKIKRARELTKIDQQLAISYLFFNPVTYPTHIINVEVDFLALALPSVGVSEKLNVIDDPTMIDFVKRDTELYKSILSNFRVREEDKQPIVVVQESVTRPIPQITEQKKEPRANDYYSSLRDSIINTHKEALSEDSDTRLDYFIEDVLQRGYENEKLKQFGDSFSHFNLAKRIRRREDRPKDTQFRTFFDDVTLRYVMRGEVPTAQDLEHLYEKDCKSEVSKSAQ